MLHWSNALPLLRTDFVFYNHATISTANCAWLVFAVIAFNLPCAARLVVDREGGSSPERRPRQSTAVSSQ